MELPSGKIAFNKNKALMLGRNPDDFTHYNDFMEIVHPDDYENAMQIMRQLIGNKRDVYECEYRIKNSNGDYLWFHDIGKIVSNINGKIKLTGIVTNITERKIAEEKLQKLNAELSNTVEELQTANDELDAKNQIITKERQALKDSEERYRKVIEHLPMGLVELDHDAKVIEWNQAMEKITEIEKQTIHNKPVWELTNMLLPEKDMKKQVKEYLKKEIPRALQTGKAKWLNKTIRNSYRSPSNEIRQVEAHKFLIPDSKGNRIGAIMHDITERLKTQKALKESEQKIRTIVTTLPDLLFHFDNNGKFLSFYQESNVLLKKPKDFINKSIFEVFDKEYAHKVQNCIAQTLKNKTFEHNYTMKINDETHYFRAKYSKLKENEVIALVSDITTLKKQEAKIARQNDDLKEAIATKNKFFNIIAHDLKNPFSSILGLSELLIGGIERYDKQKIKKFVASIHESSTNTYKLLENLLQWARAQQGKSPFKPQKQLLHEIVYETVLLSQNQANAKKIGVEYTVSPQIEIYADAEMMKTIIRNLISNAIKYTNPNGKIFLSAQTTGENAHVSVKDTGIGMDEKTRKTLFKIGESTSKQGTQGERGTGFGLMICKEFVEKHNGKIDVQSQPGKGSTFSFTVPLYNDEA